MEPLIVAVDDPRSADIKSLLALHLVFANTHSPPEDVHALDLDGLLVPEITFFSARRDGELLGVGALKQLDPDHLELKSMHTAAAARGQGVGRAMLAHLLGIARGRGSQRVSLETGSMAAFTPAHRLYEAAGFTRCEPFADYVPSRNSVCMTLLLEPAN